MFLTGWSLHLPGVDLPADLAELGAPLGEWASVDAVPAEQAAAVLGRKGLLSKEPATRLALCAVHRALGLPLGQRPTAPYSPDTAVVAASALGNVEAVARVARTVDQEGGRAVSVLDAPNVSSNVVASSVALWFRFGGPNLMVCSGRSSGVAGLRLAALLLRAGRAEKVVLVGAEPADDVARTLHGGRLRAGSACVVLADGVPGDEQPIVELSASAGPSRITVGPGGFDPVSRWGDFYGAHDVVTLALAAHLAVDEGYRSAAVSFGDGDPAVSIHLARFPAGEITEGVAAR